MAWHVTVEEDSDKVTFLGVPGRFLARPFRGRIHRELALGLRSLEVPSCRNQVRDGWHVAIPAWWEQRNNARDRTLVVFRCPNIGETVLEFDKAVPLELERALAEAFRVVNVNDKEKTDGSEEQQRRAAQAGGRVLSLPEGGGAAGEGERGGHGQGAQQPDQPAGERQVAPEKRRSALKRLFRKKRKRGRR